jgi:hypothetical protein
MIRSRNELWPLVHIAVCGVEFIVNIEPVEFRLAGVQF